MGSSVPDRRGPAAAVAPVVIVVLASALALPSCTNSGPDSTFTPSVSYWLPTVEGSVEIDAGSNPGTSTHADLNDDLGLSRDDQWVGKLDIDLGDQTLTFQYLPLRMKGDGPVDEGFIYHGATYSSGDFVTTELNLTTYVLDWDTKVTTNKKSKDSLRFGVGAWWWEYDAQVKGTVSGNDERRSFSRVYPDTHAAWTYGISKDFTADLAGSFATMGLDQYILDLSGGVAYQLSDGMRAVIGYRWIRWDFDEKTNDGDFTLSGPIATLTLRF